jgi:hypothetical protein
MKKMYEVHTEETVHGMYLVIASSDEEARNKFDSGDIYKPSIYEAVSVEITEIKNGAQ